MANIREHCYMSFLKPYINHPVLNMSSPTKVMVLAQSAIRCRSSYPSPMTTGSVMNW